MAASLYVMHMFLYILPIKIFQWCQSKAENKKKTCLKCFKICKQLHGAYEEDNIFTLTFPKDFKSLLCRFYLHFRAASNIHVMILIFTENL